MGFKRTAQDIKIELEGPYADAMKKLRGGFYKKTPFKKPSRKKIGVMDVLRLMNLNKGGIVSKTKTKFKGHF